MISKRISRDDLLVLLFSMGVVLPKDNKLPEEELSKRLGEALDTSQEYSQVIKKAPVDPLSLPKWSSEEKTLYQASQRGSLMENFGASFPSNAVSLAKEHTFKEMKQTLLGVAYTFDLGVKEISFLTHDDTWGVFIRVIGVYCLNNDIPLTYILYKELNPTPDTPMDVLRRQVRLEQDNVTSRISDLEGRAILTLFEQNGARLDPKLLQLAESQTVKNSGFRPSFILPLCSINMRDLGHLTKDSGCDVCGEKTSARCSQCMSVSYCSKDCQRADWKIHKSTCKSIQGGSWHTITVSTTMPGMPKGGVFSVLNTRDSLHKRPSTENVPSSIPDAHETKIFLAKFQIPLSPMASHMMIYDRQKHFQAFWMRNTNPKLFDEGHRSMQGRMKMYRWMKRISDNQYAICLDRSPEQDPQW